MGEYEEEATLELAQMPADKKLGVFPSWQVVEPFAYVEVAAGADSLQAAGLSLDSGKYPMFPGSLTATRKKSAVLKGGSTTDGRRHQADQTTLQVSDQLNDAVVKQVRSAVGRS